MNTNIMYEALGKARDMFKLYAELHRAKGTVDSDAKAKVNEDMVATINEALSVQPEPITVEAIYAAWHGAGVDIAGGNWKCFAGMLPHSPPAQPAPANENDWTEVDLWAEIHRLRAAVQGPDGYATWQDAAVDERIKRVKAERTLRDRAHPAREPRDPPECLRTLGFWPDCGCGECYAIHCLDNAMAERDALRAEVSNLKQYE